MRTVVINRLVGVDLKMNEAPSNVKMKKIVLRQQSSVGLFRRRLAQHEVIRTMLTGKDGERINHQRLNIGTLNFDYGHLVAINRESPARVAGDRNQAESVAKVL